MGVNEAGDRGRRGGGREFFGAGVYQNLFILLILLYFYVLQCNNWVSEVSNRCNEVNSGILTMNPVLISLHRQGVFRQPWSTWTSFASDFGSSLVDYFPLIPKIADVSVAVHTLRNNYPSVVDNRFICSLLDMDFCAVQKQKQKNKKKKKKKKKHFKIQHEFSDRSSKHVHVARWDGWVRQRGRVSYVTEACK